MSRVGNKPVAVPTGVEITIDPKGSVVAKGKLGSLTMDFDPVFVTFEQEGAEILVKRLSESKTCRARHGLYRSLLANLLEGVTAGFSKRLEIRGVGYRGKATGQEVELNLGFSHSISYSVPEGVTVKFDDKSQIFFTVSGIDKQLVGQVAAELRSYRKPEPYKGKGIRYVDEFVLRKAGKSGKA